MNSIKLGKIGTGAKLYMVDGKDFFLLKNYVDSKMGGITIPEVDEHLGIDREDGRADYVLNEKGEMVELPEADLSDYYTKDETEQAIENYAQPAGDYATSTDLANKVDKEAGKSLIADTEITRLATVTNQTQSDVDTYLTINRLDGNDEQFLNKKGEFVGVEHSATVNKNSEADFQHVNQAEKDAIASIGDINTALELILSIEV